MLAGADEPYRVLVERMNEGVLTVGPDGRILFANDRLSELTGYPTEVLIDRHIATLFAGEAPELVPDASLEANLLRRDETQLPVKVWARTISLGEKAATLVTLTDLSVYRRAEQLAAAERFTRSILEQATTRLLCLRQMAGSLTRAGWRTISLNNRPSAVRSPTPSRLKRITRRTPY